MFSMAIFPSSSYLKLKYYKSEYLSLRFSGLIYFARFPLMVRNIIPYRFDILKTFGFIKVDTASASIIVDYMVIKISLAPVVMISDI